MNNIKLFVFTFLVLGMTACQPEVTREVIRETSPANQNNRSEGGADEVGGGNGLNGRTLERYAFKLLKNDIFKTHVLPIIENLNQTHPRFASDLVHIAIERKWYAVNVRLNKIPSEIIGVGFQDESAHQQIALQNLRSIWIDTKYFNAEESDDAARASLILHELVMGVRLMQFKSGLDKCLSETAYKALAVTYSEKNTDAAKLYNQLRDKCAATYLFDQNDPVAPGYGKVQLSKDDYDNIRELVLNLEESQGNISKVQLEAWLKERKFRQY